MYNLLLVHVYKFGFGDGFLFLRINAVVGLLQAFKLGTVMMTVHCITKY